jgi:membrane protease YdiL (CAAX protease family)
MADTEARRGVLARHLVLTLFWFGMFRVLGEHAISWLPRALLARLTLQSYLTGVQIATALLGLGFAFLLLPDARSALGLEPPRLARLGVWTLMAPALFVLVSYAAIYAALPTLLEELRQGGRQAVQQSTGQFGRELTEASVLSALVWGVVVSPLAEELMFRGALWSLVDRGVRSFSREAPAPTSAVLPSGVIADGLGLRAARALFRFLVTGGIATLVSAGVFAWMHADMPGGLGIVRWVSALGLGLSLGVARHASGGLSAPIAVHVIFNLCSLATTRRWLSTESFPMKRGVPTLLSLVAAILVLGVLVGWGVRRATRAPRPG